ncbi:MAG: (d)CMP kinase [Gammaproteobacteria bacterium]|jgi:cytidylate kinase|nr:(d)CMP kinase [Gammaproteobacteria bacterium]
MIHNKQIITIDGPSGVGKGTLAQLLAKKLGWHFLDSGALYRITAYAALQKKIPLDDVPALCHVAQNLKVQFIDQKILFEGADIQSQIRQEEIGLTASKIGAHQALRDALYQLQRAFLKGPGLVADGRDMGTAIFPEAQFKFFLTAQDEERAQRRFLQLKNAGTSANLAEILYEIKARDERDRTRTASPLKPAGDAIQIDTSHLSIEQVLEKVLLICNL